MDVVSSSQQEIGSKSFSESVMISESVQFLSTLRNDDLASSLEADFVYSPEVVLTSEQESSPGYSPWNDVVVLSSSDSEMEYSLSREVGDSSGPSTGEAKATEGSASLVPREGLDLGGLCNYADKSPFFARATYFLLTINSLPKHCTPAEVMDYYLNRMPIKRNSKRPDFVLAATEIGKTGYYHGHVFLRFPASKMIKNGHSMCFPYEENRHHVNIKVVRYPDVKVNAEYVMKDGNYVCSSTVILDQLILSRDAKAKPLNELCKRLMDGSSVEDIVTEDNCHLVMSNLPKLYDFANFVRTRKIRIVDPPKWPGIKAGETDVVGHNVQIVRWLEANLKYFGSSAQNRPIKTPNLWLVSESNKGKTTFVLFLSKFFKVFFYKPDAGKNFWPRDIESYDIIFIDEFYGQIPFSEFKRITDGSPVSLDVKNGQQFTRLKNIPIIIATNNWPCDIYHNVYEKNEDADSQIRNRFHIVHVNSMIQLYTERSINWNGDEILPNSPIHTVVSMI